MRSTYINCTKYLFKNITTVQLPWNVGSRCRVLSGSCSRHCLSYFNTTHISNNLTFARQISISSNKCLNLSSTCNNSVKNNNNETVKTASVVSGDLEVRFGNDSVAKYSKYWLRDNCQCDVCYDHTSHTRRLILDQWGDHDAVISNVKYNDTTIEVVWGQGDGHTSKYEVKWLKERSFNTAERNVRRNLVSLEKIHWDKTHKISSYSYNSLLNDERQLLSFLMTLEQYGLALIKDTPRQPKACMSIVNKTGFVKQTHYGIHYPIQSKAAANSLAYTDSRLGIHNDLPYYDHIPGIIFLHCISQIEGSGGVNQLIDSFRVAQMMKDRHPDAYDLLTTRPVYFWNKGVAQVEGETTEFLKLLNVPVIMLNYDGSVKRVNVSQLRDSYLDLPEHEVTPWYEAVKLYSNYLLEEALLTKLDAGDTLVMDNHRLMHGRTAYDGSQGERYMDQIYLDWDEALSKRRVLFAKYGTPS